MTIVAEKTETEGDINTLADRLATLTRRESEVMELLILGLSNEQIALKLFRSAKTIDKHCQNIYQKIGIRKRVNLVREVLNLRSATQSASTENHDLPIAAMEGIVQKSAAWDKLRKFDSLLARSAGVEYFGNLCKALAETFGVKMAGICEVNVDEGAGDIIAFCVDGELQVPFSYKLENSLCGATFAQGILEHLDNLQERFGDEVCQIPQKGFDSYVGLRLEDKLMGPIGVLWISNVQPIDESEMVLEILRFFAPSVAAELAVQIALDRAGAS